MNLFVQIVELQFTNAKQLVTNHASDDALANEFQMENFINFITRYKTKAEISPR